MGLGAMLASLIPRRLEVSLEEDGIAVLCFDTSDGLPMRWLFHRAKNLWAWEIHSLTLTKAEIRLIWKKLQSVQGASEEGRLLDQFRTLAQQRRVFLRP